MHLNAHAFVFDPISAQLIGDRQHVDIDSEPFGSYTNYHFAHTGYWEKASGILYSPTL